MARWLLLLLVFFLLGCMSKRIRNDSVLRTMAEPVAKGEYACQHQHGYACEGLGHLVLLGGSDGVPSVEAARDYFKMGCRHGDERNCDQLLQLRLYGRNLMRLVPECLDGKDVGVCVEAGRAYLFGLRAVSAPKLALRLLSTGCHMKTDRPDVQSEACGLAALALLAGVGSTDRAPELAVTLLRSWCESGNDHACGYLGFAHEMGLGVSRDLDRATTLYRFHPASTLARYRLAALTMRQGGMSPSAAMTKFSELCVGPEDGAPPVARIACHTAATLALEHGWPHAQRFAALSCRKGWPPGCRLVGEIFDAQPLSLDLRSHP